MNTLNKLNDCSNTFEKISELAVNKRYKVNKMEAITTKYGDTILVYLDEFSMPFILPKRFAKLITYLDKLNKSFESESIFMQKEEKINNYTPINFYKSN